MKRKIIASLVGTTLLATIALGSVNVSAASVLKSGMSGSEVTTLQQNLKKLGFFSVNPTGYYGSITTTSVKNIQSRYGLQKDGIAGKQTLSLIDSLLGKTAVNNSIVLKSGMSSNEVTKLQQNLKKLGYFSVTPTGYYGSITTTSVKNLQSNYGLQKDGIAGKQTLALIDNLLKKTVSSVSTSSNTKEKYMLPWFGNAENVFPRGKKATVLDIETGLTFNVMRTYGTNHADVEALTAADTKILKKIYGGQFSWTRRAVIVTVDGKKIAASMAGMPHAGLDSKPADVYVQSRSMDYGAGINLDTVKKNDMDGHFDIHFLGSRTHGTNSVNEAHQTMVNKAAEWAVKNL